MRVRVGYYIAGMAVSLGLLGISCAPPGEESVLNANYLNVDTKPSPSPAATTTLAATTTPPR